MTLFTSGTTWLIIATWVITIGNAVIPVVPASVAAIIGSIVTIAALYVHNGQIKAGAVK